MAFIEPASARTASETSCILNRGILQITGFLELPQLTPQNMTTNVSDILRLESVDSAANSRRRLRQLWSPCGTSYLSASQDDRNKATGTLLSTCHESVRSFSSQRGRLGIDQCLARGLESHSGSEDA